MISFLRCNKLFKIRNKQIVNFNCNFSHEFSLKEFQNKYLHKSNVFFTENLEIKNWRNNKPFPIFRVTDSNGIFINKKIESEFSKELIIKFYKCMIKLNTMDKILYESQRQGRISFYMTNFGEEASHIGSAAALKFHDLVYGQYRETGVLLWRNFSIQQIIHQCFGTKYDLGKGKQMPVHYGSANINFVTISSPLTTQLPQAVGSAYSMKIKNKNIEKKQIVCVYFGDGAASEGDAHAAFNFAATLQCPIIFFCRNNGYAISTPVIEQYLGDGIAGKGVAYGLQTIRVDGNDLFAVYKATLEARKLAIENKPVLIEALNYRIGHHSTSDDASAYRSKCEEKQWLENDYSITRLKKYLTEKGWWSTEEEKILVNCIRKEVLQALNVAEKTLFPSIKEMFSDVYAELPKHLQKQQTEFYNHLTNYGKNYSLAKFES